MKRISKPVRILSPDEQRASHSMFGGISADPPKGNDTLICEKCKQPIYENVDLSALAGVKIYCACGAIHELH